MKEDDESENYFEKAFNAFTHGIGVANTLYGYNIRGSNLGPLSNINKWI